MILSTLFHSYQGYSLNTHVFPGFHQDYTRALKCLVQGYSQEKNRLDPVKVKIMSAYTSPMTALFPPPKDFCLTSGFTTMAQ